MFSLGDYSKLQQQLQDQLRRKDEEMRRKDAELQALSEKQKRDANQQTESIRKLERDKAQYASVATALEKELRNLQEMVASGDLTRRDPSIRPVVSDINISKSSSTHTDSDGTQNKNSNSNHITASETEEEIRNLKASLGDSKKGMDCSGAHKGDSKNASSSQRDSKNSCPTMTATPGSTKPVPTPTGMENSPASVLNEMQAELHKLKEQAKAQQEREEFLMEEIHSLGQANHALQKNLEAARQSLTEKTIEAQKLKLAPAHQGSCAIDEKLKDELEGNIRTLQVSLEKVQKNRDDLVAQVTEENNKLRTKLEEVVATSGERKATECQLSDENAMLRDDLIRLSEEKARLKDQISSLQEENFKVKEESASRIAMAMEESTSNLSEENAKLKAEKSKLIEEKRLIHEDRTKLKEQKAAAELQQTAAESKLEEQAKQSSDKEKEHKKALSDMEREQMRMAEMIERDLMSKISDINSSNDAKVAELQEKHQQDLKLREQQFSAILKETEEKLLTAKTEISASKAVEVANKNVTIERLKIERDEALEKLKDREAKQATMERSMEDQTRCIENQNDRIEHQERLLTEERNNFNAMLTEKDAGWKSALDKETLRHEELISELKQIHAAAAGATVVEWENRLNETRTASEELKATLEAEFEERIKALKSEHEGELSGNRIVAEEKMAQIEEEWIVREKEWDEERTALKQERQNWEIEQQKAISALAEQSYTEKMKEFEKECRTVLETDFKKQFSDWKWEYCTRKETEIVQILDLKKQELDQQNAELLNQKIAELDIQKRSMEDEIATQRKNMDDEFRILEEQLEEKRKIQQQRIEEFTDQSSAKIDGKLEEIEQREEALRNRETRLDTEREELSCERHEFTDLQHNERQKLEDERKSLYDKWDSERAVMLEQQKADLKAELYTNLEAEMQEFLLETSSPTLSKSLSEEQLNLRKTFEEVIEKRLSKERQTRESEFKKKEGLLAKEETLIQREHELMNRRDKDLVKREADIEKERIEMVKSNQRTLEQMQAELEQERIRLEEQKAEIVDKKAINECELEVKTRAMRERGEQLERKDQELKRKDKELADQAADLCVKGSELILRHEELEKKEADLNAKKEAEIQSLRNKEAEIQNLRKSLQNSLDENENRSKNTVSEQFQSKIDVYRDEVKEKEIVISEKERELREMQEKVLHLEKKHKIEVQIAVQHTKHKGDVALRKFQKMVEEQGVKIDTRKILQRIMAKKEENKKKGGDSPTKGESHREDSSLKAEYVAAKTELNNNFADSNQKSAEKSQKKLDRSPSAVASLLSGPRTQATNDSWSVINDVVSGSRNSWGALSDGKNLGTPLVDGSAPSVGSYNTRGSPNKGALRNGGSIRSGSSANSTAVKSSGVTAYKSSSKKNYANSLFSSADKNNPPSPETTHNSSGCFSFDL